MVKKGIFVSTSHHSNVIIGYHGNVNISCYGYIRIGYHGNVSIGCHGDGSIDYHGNLSIGCHGNISIRCHGNEWDDVIDKGVICLFSFDDFENNSCILKYIETFYYF